MSMNVQGTTSRTKLRLVIYGIIFALAYWLFGSIRTLILTDLDFWHSLWQPGGWDLVIRIIIALAIIVTSIRMQKHVDQKDTENHILSTSLTNRKNMLEDASCPIVILDEKMRITEINNAVADLTGQKVDALLMQDVLKALFYQPDFSQIRSSLDGDAKLEDSVKLRVRRPQECYVTFTTATETTDQGTKKTYLFLQETTTLVNQLNSTMTKSHIMRRFLEHSEHPLAILNANHVLVWNQAMQSLTGLVAEGLTSADIKQWLETIPEHQELLAVIEDTWETGGLHEFEMPLVLTDAQNVEIRIETSTLDTTDTKYLVITAADITLLRSLISQNMNLASNLEESQNQFATLQNMLAVKEQQLHDDQNKLETLKQELESAHERTTQLQNSLEQRSDEIVQLQTELKTSRESKAEQATRITSLQEKFAAMSIPIMELSHQGLITMANQAAQDLLNVKANDLLKAILYGTDEQQKLENMITQIANGKQRVLDNLEFNIAGNQIILECHGIPLKREQPSMLLYGYDVTAHHTSYRELALSLDQNKYELKDILTEVELERDRISTILSCMDDGVVITDVYNRVTLMNRAAEDLLNIRLSEVLERPVHFVIKDRTILEQLQKTQLDGLTDNVFQLAVTVPNSDKSVALTCKTSIIRDKHNREQGVLIHLRQDN